LGRLFGLKIIRFQTREEVKSVPPAKRSDKIAQFNAHREKMNKEIPGLTYNPIKGFYTLGEFTYQPGQSNVERVVPRLARKGRIQAS